MPSTVCADALHESFQCLVRLIVGITIRGKALSARGMEGICTNFTGEDSNVGGAAALISVGCAGCFMSVAACGLGAYIVILIIDFIFF